MADSHLNSVHLDFPRREDFRQAREALLSARGNRTISLENFDASGPAHGSHTMIEGSHPGAPDNTDYWLLDQDAIYPLKVGVNTIGRLPDNDVVVPVPYISRRHCAILVHSNCVCELHDVASKNGTFLNGNRLSGPTPLSSGDEIRMCDRQLIFMSKHARRRGSSEHDNTLSE